ncbi:MAG TPA: hypothetical protein VFT51_11700 [Bacillales bacterium]|nr:hypothetical protein [Bacillales bacterium]
MACHDKLDDMLDEQRKEYDALPRLSSVDKIMSRIETEVDRSKKRSRRKRKFLPLAAGIAAVFVLAALALSQFQAGPGQQIASDHQSGNTESGQLPEGEAEMPNGESAGSGNSSDQGTEAVSPYVPEKTPTTIDETNAALEKMKETGASPGLIDKVFTKFLQSRTDVRTEQSVKLNKLGQIWLASNNQNNYRELMPGFENPKQIEDPKLQSFAEKLDSEGFRVITREGSLELRFDYGKLQKVFVPFVSDTMDTYLTIKADPIVYSEGTFEGNWNHLGGKLVEIDGFLKENPEFPFAKELKANYDKFLHWYLFGNLYKKTTTDGSTIVKDEVKQSFQALIQDNPDTFTARVVEKYYNQIKQNGFAKVPQESFEMPDFPPYLK